MFSDGQCPIPVYFNTPFSITYLSGIETFNCQTEIEFSRVYFLWFCTKYDT